MSIYKHLDYRAFLLERAQQQGRGARSQWAHVMDCQKGYLTQVLSGSANLSLEQADRLGRHLGLNDTEYDYFLLLVERARAGTPALELHFTRKLEDLRQRQRAVRERFREDHQLILQNQITFYSSWRYAAVHLCLTIERLRRPEVIAETLKLPLSTVRETLEFLIQAGLARVADDGRFIPVSSHSFLSGDSPLISKHHLNWRVQALEALDRNRPEDIHYSAVVSVSRADRERLHRLLLETIAEFKKTVRDSVNETELQVLTLDFFALLA